MRRTRTLRRLSGRLPHRKPDPQSRALPGRRRDDHRHAPPGRNRRNGPPAALLRRRTREAARRQLPPRFRRAPDRRDRRRIGRSHRADRFTADPFVGQPALQTRPHRKAAGVEASVLPRPLLTEAGERQALFPAAAMRLGNGAFSSPGNPEIETRTADQTGRSAGAPSRRTEPAVVIYSSLVSRTAARSYPQSFRAFFRNRH